MPKFAVTVEGVDYEVDAPDESTAWAWGWQFHRQSMAEQPPVAAPPVAAPPVAAPPVAAPPVAAPPVAAPPVAAPEMVAPPPPSAPPSVPPSAPVVPPSAPSIPAATDIATPPAVAPEVSSPGILSQLGRQVGLTARMGAEGAAGLLGTFTDPVAALINQFVPPENRLKTLQSVMSQILTQAGVPEPANEIERIVQRAGSGMVGAAGGVAAARQAGAAMTGPTGQVIAGQLAAMPGAQIAAGGGASGASQAAAEAGVGPAGQTAAGLVGGVAGGLAASPRSISVTSQPVLSDVEAAAARTGVPLMRSDISPPQTGITRGIQRAGEAVPGIGTTRPRLAQQQARERAVTDAMREYSDRLPVDQTVPQALIADLKSKRSTEVNKYNAMKNDVFTRLAGAGEIPLPNTIEALDGQIARLRNLQAKGFDDEIRAVQDQIKSLRSSRLELPKGYKQEQLANLRQELVTLKEQNKRGRIYEPAIKILEDWKAALPGKNIQEIEALRSQLGENFSTPELTNMRTVSQKAISSIYGALRNDMGDFIKENGQRRDFTKFSVANKRLKGLVDELDSKILNRAFNEGDIKPEVVENMLFSKAPSEIKLLYDGLTPYGRSVARAAIISRAARESEVQEGARTAIDPSKFADSVKNLGESVNVFFTGDDLQRIEGLVKVLNTTRRAGEVAARAVEEPSVGKMAGTVGTVTGVAGLPLAGLYQLFGGGILGGAAATVGVGTLGAAARIYESPAMRDLLRKIAAAKPGEEMALITKLSTLKVPAPQPEPQP